MAVKTVTNKTKRPLSIPLPRGKTLHLSPGKSGQIAANAADHPPVKKLVAEGVIDVHDEGLHAAEGSGGGKGGGSFMPGHGSTATSRRSGDR